jgi:predicted phosphohydrolase
MPWLLAKLPSCATRCHIRIVCLSDTHGQLDTLTHPIPEGDVVVHAGDLTWRGTEVEIAQELTKLNALPHRHKILVSGNHDFFFDERHPHGHRFRDWYITRYNTIEQMLAAHAPTVTYLQDSGVDIEGVRFYGSPWQTWFHDWAFNFPWHDFGIKAREVWAQVPDECDVLVTHAPPDGILDAGDDGRLGCPTLRQTVEELPNLKLHVFGHIHERAGIEVRGTKTFVNASICNRDYIPVNPPIVVEL